MARFFAALCLIVLVATTAGLGARALHADPEHASPDHAAPAEAPVAIGPLPLAAVGGGSPADIEAWIKGVRDGEWYEGVEAARLEAARQAASVRVATPGAREGVGDCTGFAIPDHIIQRESGGNPYAVNPSSGAFGCAQVMPMHWNSGGACADLDRYSVEDQRTCVDWLSEGGSRLSPWAATR